MANSKQLILIADDDENMREDLADTLSDHPYTLIFAESAKEAVEKARSEEPDLVVLDLVFPDSRELAPLRQLRSLPNAPEVIMLSGQTVDFSFVVEAVKLGAFDYVSKPYSGPELLNRIEKALHLRSLRSNQRTFLKQLRGVYGLEQLVGNSQAMQQVRETITRLADLDGCVLIQGDSGTGKELAARALHYMGRRASRPFVVVNCASIPESLTESILFGHKKGSFTGAVDTALGKFEIAEDGTILLDEVGDMPLRQQATLLRVLEYRRFTPVGESRDRECKARFVFATNRNLRQAVKEEAFREDLFHRINVATIHMPALSSRHEDIPNLANYFVSKLSSEMGRSPVLLGKDVLQVFNRYDWPGNVRELRNVLEASLMLLGKDETELTASDLPQEIVTLPNQDDTKLTLREQREKEDITESLKKFGWNQSKAARALGYHRNTIRAKIRYYGIAVANAESDSGRTTT